MATFFYFRRTEAGIAMCSPKLKSVIIGSNGQQLDILGLSKLVVLLIKRVFQCVARAKVSCIQA